MGTCGRITSFAKNKFGAGEHEADMGLQACIRFDAILFLQIFLE